MGLCRADINYVWLAAADAARGDKETALAALQKVFDAGFHDFAALDTSPCFKSLRTDRRFPAVAQRYRKGVASLRRAACQAEAASKLVI
jgi:hypothetical protein